MLFDIPSAIAGVSDAVKAIIQAAWPSPEDKVKSEAIAAIANADAAVKQLQAAQAVMLAEAQSTDPWTSRARPTFLYVIYTLILFSLPMGVLFAFKPDVAKSVIEGFHAWLVAIPEPYLQLFGIGYLGYTGGRSWEKVKGIKK